MVTHAGFLRSVVESPEDDVPRLVYADWLEDQGEAPRAELIRVQCELARGVEDGARLVQLTLRQRELIARHADDWLGPFSWQLGNTVRYERGLIPFLFFGTSEFLKPKMQRAAAEWFPRGGVLGVELSNRTKSLSDLFDCPLLTDLGHLQLEHTALGDDGIRRLVAGDRCRSLRSLSLVEHHASGAGLRHLARAASLGGLTSLTLKQIPLDSAALKTVLDSPYLRSLTSLCLTETRQWKDDLPSLAASDGWRRLRQLQLLDTHLDGDELRTLLGRNRLSGLRSLYLWGNCLRSTGVDALARRGAMKSLERLRFGLDRDFDSIDLRHLMSALDSLPALKHLRLEAVPIFGSLESHLPHLSRLESLALDYCNLEDSSLRALLASRRLARLRSITVEGHNIEVRSLPSLLKGARRPRLRELSLCVSGNSGEAARAILTSGVFPALIRLELNGSAPYTREQAKLQRQYPQVLIQF
jgi:uncharacterized protein (TIGR02996 family)